MPDRSNPVATSVLGTVTLGADTAEEQRNITRLVEFGLRADRERTGWLDHQRALTKLRYGLRRPKVFPWKGASNLSIPFIDASIRKYKPMLMRLVVEPDPVVEFVGEDEEAVGVERVAETVYNWLFKTDMQALEPIAYIIDTMCHRGFAFAQVAWEYKTEYECRTIPVHSLFPQGVQGPEQVAQVLVQEYDLNVADPRVQRALKTAVERIMQGAEFVKLAFKRVIADRPALYDRDPVQVITPPRTTDPANSEWLIIQHVLSIRQIEQFEADEFFLPGSVKAIQLDRVTAPQANVNNTDLFVSPALYAQRQLDDERERLWGKENDDNILVWEIYHWHDIDGDGLRERVVTYVHPRSKRKLRSTAYSAPWHKWPIVKFDFEKISRRWHSPRGISQLLRDLQKEINTQHNSRIDGMMLRNSPIYQIPITAGFKAKNFRAVPGEVIHVPFGSRLEPLVQDRGAYPEMVNEENLLRNIGETYIGVFDAALTSPQSPTSARTATEIQATMQYTAATSTFDAILFQMAMRELHTMIWELWLDLGPEEVVVKVLGKDPSQNEPLPLRVKKADVAKRFKLIPTGTVANTNRALETAHAREAMQIFWPDQTGLIDKHELARWYLNLLSYRWARRILLAPEQAAEVQAMRQAASELATNGDLNAVLGLGNVPPPETEEQEMPSMGESAVT